MFGQSLILEELSMEPSSKTTDRLWLIVGLLIAALWPSPAVAAFNFSFWNNPTATGGSPSFTDNFTRANASPISNPSSSGGSWYQSALGTGSYAENKILSDLAAPTSASTNCYSFISSPSFGNNQTCTVTLTAGGIASGSYCGPVVRMQSTSNISGYVLQTNGGSSEVVVVKITDSGGSISQNPILDYSTPLTAGDTIGISASGTTSTLITVYHNGASVSTVTDSSSPFTGGQPGLSFYQTTVSAPISAVSATSP
jgi:hypothetical protein